MIDLIFIGIIAVFIAGMLWSDRDSRRANYLDIVAKMYGLCLHPDETVFELRDRILVQLESEETCQ